MHILISADAGYLHTHAVVSIVSAIETGHQVLLQVIRSEGWQEALEPYIGIPGLEIWEIADAPAQTAAGYTMPRLQALPAVLRQHDACWLLDADIYVRQPMIPPAEIAISQWPWRPTPGQLQGRAEIDGTTPEWCDEWLRLMIAPGMYLGGPDGLQFAEAISREARMLIHENQLGWGCDQVALWRAFVKEFPPIHFLRTWYGISGEAPMDQPTWSVLHPNQKDEAPWQNLIAEHRDKLQAMR